MTGDIVKRITNDFNTESKAAIILLEQFRLENSYITDRVIRCILALSKGSIEELENNIAFARVDWRDVILWAEKYDFQYNEPFSD